MLRKKIIDTDEIRWKKIDQEIIEKKNCLGVELVFNTPLGQRQSHTMRTYYGIDVDESELTASRKIKNSWKGLVMLLLSLIYCKYGKSTLSKLYRSNGCAGKKYQCHLSFSWNYEVFLSDDERAKLDRDATVYLSSDELVLALNQDVKHGFHEGICQQGEANLRALLKGLPPNPTFEQIAVPPSWKPCYVKGNYTLMDIEDCLMVFAKLLDLDIESSVFFTDFYKKIPYEYAIFPAKFQDTSSLVCSCPPMGSFVYGIEIVEHEVFFSELASKYVQVIDIKVPPNQIEKGNLSIYGYNLSSNSIDQLCAYFPFMEIEFHNALITMGGNAWVIFDSNHLGKWG